MTKYLLTLILFLSLLLPCSTQAQTIVTIAGNGHHGGLNGDSILAISCELVRPGDVEIDDSGNVYIADVDNYCIRKIDINGIITTVAGIGGNIGYSGDGGPAIAAQLGWPYSIALDNKHNLYIADQRCNCIRKVDSAGIIYTVAGNGSLGFSGDGGMATNAKLNECTGVTVDKKGNIYVCDDYNNRIRKIDTAGIITTIAGNGTAGFGGDNGPATAALMEYPVKITVDTLGNLYVSTVIRIRKIDTSGIITTIAGTGISGPLGDGGPATNASIATDGLKADKYGNIFLAEDQLNRIRKIDPTGNITTVAGCGTSGFGGDNGPATLANLSSPSGIAVDSAGHLFIADEWNYRIRSTRLGVGINDLNHKNNNLSIYPNPCNGAFRVQLKDKENVLKLSVTDVLGRELNIALSKITDLQTEVSLEAPNGIYFISAITSSGTYFEKIIVKR